MTAFVLRRTDLSNYVKDDVSDYDVPLENLDGSSGTVSLSTRHDDTDMLGEWLYMDNTLLLISRSSPNGYQTTLTVKDPAEAFDREQLPPQIIPTTYGGYIATLLADGYRNVADAAQAMPYLNIVNTDTTAYTPPQSDKEGPVLIKASDLIKEARGAGVQVRFELSGQFGRALTATISPPDNTAKTIFDSDGHFLIDQETYSRTITEKVTVITGSVKNDFYLKPDGSVSSTPPAARVRGSWKTVIRDEADELTPAEEAAKIFAENVNTRNITFYDDRRYHLGQKLNLRLKGTVYQTEITYVGKSAKNDLYFYKCGNLSVTLVDYVRTALQKIEKLEEKPVEIPSNTNLLLNAWFTVNQKKATSASGGAFGVDAWYTTSTSNYTVHDGYLSCTCTAANNLIYQKIENGEKLAGKTVTLSAIINGQLRTHTVTLPDTFTEGWYSSGTVVGNVYLRIYYGTKLQASVSANAAVSNVQIKAGIKLEQGSVSTLLNDEAPDDTLELIKCKRFFQRIGGVNTSVHGYGGIASTPNRRVFVSLPIVGMRTTPAVTYSGTVRCFSDISTSMEIESIAVWSSDQSSVTLNVTMAAALDGGKVYLLRTDSTAYIDLSAEL